MQNSAVSSSEKEVFPFNTLKKKKNEYLNNIFDFKCHKNSLK